MLLSEGALIWPLLPADQPPGDPTLWGQACDGAVEWLWAATGRQFGTRPAVYRPAGLALSGAYYAAIPYLQSIYGPLLGQGWPFLGDPRASDRTHRQVVELPGPAVAVSQVQLVDGAGAVTVLDPSLYRLDGNYLVRVDGSTWPTTQDLIANDGQANTWHVTYSRGAAVPTIGQVAAARLAGEWLKLLSGDASCKLPWNTTNVTRGGVTVQRQVDPTTARRVTGIELVDRWVATVNPAGLSRPGVVWSPDLARNAAPYAGAGLPYRPLG